MPVIKDGPLKGLRAEMIRNPLGVPGRMNPAQLFEQEINFIGLYKRHELKNAKTLKSKKKILLDHYMDLYDADLKSISPDMISKQYEFTVRFFNEASDEELEKFFDELIKLGIPVHQGPFTDNLDIFKLASIYKKHPEYKKFSFERNIDGKHIEIENDMVMGEIYTLRLKHQPDNKNSMRSTGTVDLKDLPTKDRSYKEFKTLYPKTSVRFGEQEVINSFLTEDKTAIKELLNSYGINEEDSYILENELLTGNPFDIDIEFSNTKSRPAKIIDNFNYGMGIVLDIDGSYDNGNIREELSHEEAEYYLHCDDEEDIE